MQYTKHFEDLIPYVLRSVPYIHQSHTCKAYYALERLYTLRPQLSNEVWKHCISIIKNDEPKVEGIIEPDLLKIHTFTDETSGRIFGPDWILGRGLMPMSYWAMNKKIEHVGFEEVVKEYAIKALDHPRYLGHEISVLTAHWYFYKNVVIFRPKDDQMLFLQRLPIKTLTVGRFLGGSECLPEATFSIASQSKPLLLSRPLQFAELCVPTAS